MDIFNSNIEERLINQKKCVFFLYSNMFLCYSIACGFSYESCGDSRQQAVYHALRMYSPVNIVFALRKPPVLGRWTRMYVLSSGLSENRLESLVLRLFSSVLSSRASIVMEESDCHQGCRLGSFYLSMFLDSSERSLRSYDSRFIRPWRTD